MTTALLLVDAQRNMLTGESSIPAAADMMVALRHLLTAARQAPGTVVVHVQNDGQLGSRDEPYTPGWELMLPAARAELVVRKDQSDTFAANPELAKSLAAQGVERVVVAGLQSEYCIRATSRGALSEGFAVVLAHGAHATYNDGAAAAEISAAVENELRAEGVQVVPTADVRFG